MEAPLRESPSEGGPQECLEGPLQTLGTPMVFPKFHPCLTINLQGAPSAPRDDAMACLVSPLNTPLAHAPASLTGERGAGHIRVSIPSRLIRQQPAPPISYHFANGCPMGNHCTNVHQNMGNAHYFANRSLTVVIITWLLCKLGM